MKLLSVPFQVDPTGAAVYYQMELIDIQNDSELKRAFSEQDLLSFDSGYVPSDGYPNLSQEWTPRNSLLCLVVPTAASNRKNEKHKN